MGKICSCRAPTRPKLSHFRCGCKQETLGCKRLKIKRRTSFATRLISLRPSHANFDFLFSNFAVRDFILFTLDFNTQPEMRFNRKLQSVLMRSAFCRGVNRAGIAGICLHSQVNMAENLTLFESIEYGKYLWTIPEDHPRNLQNNEVLLHHEFRCGSVIFRLESLRHLDVRWADSKIVPREVFEN